tara:strand:+ start:447 stop:620 length:174 start_codon:yes stop_codon:yes gene_type:complete
MIEAWEEEQMSNLGCESVSDLIAEVKRLRQGIIDIADKWERPSILRGFLKELMELIE